MWVIAAAFILFIFFGFGTNVLQRGGDRRGSYIAEVNGEGIDYREFSYRLSKDVNLISGAIGINPLEERMLSDQIINELIMDKIINSKIEKRDIYVSDKQIINIIKNSPPREIYEDSSFWVGEQFDYNRYHELLRDPRLREFINNYAERIKNDLPRRILRGEVTSLVRLTNAEILENLLEDSVKIRAEYIKIPLDLWIEDETVSNPEEFYSTNKSLFKREDIVKLGYIKLPVEVDVIMVEEVKDLTKLIIERAENVPFDTLISIYSYYPRDRRLFYGWVSLEELPEIFKNELLGIKIGEISEPIQSGKGFHIIEIIDRDKDRLNLKEIYLPLFPSTEAYMSKMTEAWSLVKELRSDSIMSVPDKYEEKYITYRMGYIPDIGVDFGTFLDEPEKNNVSHPLVGENSIYVFWIRDVQSGTPAFEKIKNEVIDSMLIFEASARAREYIEENFPTDILPKNPERGSWFQTPYFTVNNYKNEGVKLPDKIVNLTFNLREGMISPPIRAGNDIYIVKLTDIKAPSQEEIQELMADYYERMQMMKQTILYQGWVYDLRKKAEIDDWRSRLYE
jgi:parvulin-like peptidyl-prolyl isomerase